MRGEGGMPTPAVSLGKETPILIAALCTLPQPWEGPSLRIDGVAMVTRGPGPPLLARFLSTQPCSFGLSSVQAVYVAAGWEGVGVLSGRLGSGRDVGVPQMLL